MMINEPCAIKKKPETPGPPPAPKYPDEPNPNPFPDRPDPKPIPEPPEPKEPPIKDPDPPQVDWRCNDHGNPLASAGVFDQGGVVLD